MTYQPMSRADAEQLVAALAAEGVKGARVEPLAWAAPGLYGADDCLVSVEPHTHWVEKGRDADTYFWDHGHAGAGWTDYVGGFAALVGAMRARQGDRP